MYMRKCTRTCRYTYPLLHGPHMRALPPHTRHPPLYPFQPFSTPSTSSSSTHECLALAPELHLASRSSIASSLATSTSMDRKDKSRRGRVSSSSAAASMAALAAAAAAGEGGSSSGSPPEGSQPPPHGEEDQKPAKLAAVGGASSASPVPARRGSAAAVGAGGPRCQAERCNANLSDAGNYYRRHKVCETHSKAAVVLVAGLRQRFCQQCSRFHELPEFDETRRSCRRRLAGHNERRRKSSTDTHTGGGGGGGGDGCRHADQDGRGHQGNPPPNHFQIR